MKMRHILLSFLLILFWTPQAIASYSDVEDNNIYIDGISYLELLGATDSATKFRPEDIINRAEAFKILFSIFDEHESNGSDYFTDIPQDTWYTEYANLAYEYDLMNFPFDQFEPAKELRRIEAINILLNAYGVSPNITPRSERSDLFADVSSSNIIYPILKRAIDLGIFEADTNEYFSPYERISRGEFAELLYKFDGWNNISLASEAESDNFYKSDIFTDIWDRILSDFYLPEGKEIDQDVLFQTAVKAMIESLNDPYSTYFTADESANFYESLNGEFEGIGALLIKDDEEDRIFATEFIDGSPAEQAGMKSGDEITHIEGVSVQGMTLEEVINRIRGPEGTTVELRIKRNGHTLAFEIERKALEIELVSSEIFDKDIWYLDIDAFANSAPAKIMENIYELESQVPNPRAIVVDLRGNAGGIINGATFISGIFVPQFTPLVHLDYGTYISTISNGDTGPYKDYPLFILVDKFSASASEIAAATLKEQADAVIIGVQTFGKGTAQRVTQYWDGSSIKLTIAHWLSSEKNSIQGVGVSPDIIQEWTSNEPDLWLQHVENVLR